MNPRTRELLETPYLADILDQPRALSETVQALQRSEVLLALRDQLRAGARRRIVLTGMGGSYQVLYPIFFRLVRAGYDAVMVETSELLYTVPGLLAPENVLVVVSQSGASGETVRLLERRGPRPFVIGVTNTEGSPLARQADEVILTRAGLEAAVSCKTAVTALAALEWLAEHLCDGQFEGLRQDLARLAPACRSYLDTWADHVETLLPLLRGVSSFFAVGRGRSLAAANLGGMIQKEAAHVHGEGMSGPAFRHGPFEFLSTASFVLIYDGDGEVSAFNRKLREDVRRAGGRAALAGWEETVPPFLLPAVPVRVRPILEMLPPQMVSLALAALHDHAPGKFERLTKVTTEE